MYNILKVQWCLTKIIKAVIKHIKKGYIQKTSDLHPRFRKVYKLSEKYCF